jgi:hypothetical protein
MRTSRFYEQNLGEPTDKFGGFANNPATILIQLRDSRRRYLLPETITVVEA